MVKVINRGAYKAHVIKLRYKRYEIDDRCTTEGNTKHAWSSCDTDVATLRVHKSTQLPSRVLWETSDKHQRIDNLLQAWSAEADAFARSALAIVGNVDSKVGIVGIINSLLVLGLAVPDLRRDLPLAEPAAVQKLHAGLCFCRLSECDLCYSFWMPLEEGRHWWHQAHQARSTRPILLNLNDGLLSFKDWNNTRCNQDLLIELPFRWLIEWFLIGFASFSLYSRIRTCYFMPNRISNP